MSDYYPIAFQKIDSLAEIVIQGIPLRNIYEDASGPAIMLNCITYYKNKKLDEFIERLDKNIDRRKPDK
jgi:hypothetical protein